MPRLTTLFLNVMLCQAVAFVTLILLKARPQELTIWRRDEGSHNRTKCLQLSPLKFSLLCITSDTVSTAPCIPNRFQ